MGASKVVHTEITTKYYSLGYNSLLDNLDKYKPVKLPVGEATA